MRADGRRANQLRPVKITRDFVKSADGSALIEMGSTRVLCTASIVVGVPRWMRDQGRGWVTAEYGMLPASTRPRKARPASIGKADGRSVEIQRLIGRSMRAVVDMEALGERTIWIDCDVIEADGGTRTASITGAWVALAQALEKLSARKGLERSPMTGTVAGASVGRLGGKVLLDLTGDEDKDAEVDMNVVMIDAARYIEIQGTAEAGSFDDDELAKALALARRGINQLRKLQLEAAGRTE